MKPHAGFWVRFVANLIDWIVLSIATGAAQLLLLGAYYWVARMGSEGGPSFADAFDGGFLQLMNSALYGSAAIAYYGWGHYRYGMTLGKRALDIRVVDATTGAGISLGQSLLRCFGYAVSYAPLFLGFVIAGMHPRKQALHDLIAGTVCVRGGQP
jgi:uncharacterized RDD family membrane protein YckC